MTLSVIPDDIPVLPESAGVTYLDEGAANAVYRLSIKIPSPEPSILEDYGDGTPPPSVVEVYDEEEFSQQVDPAIFEDKLLRLRKNLPTAPSCLVSQAAYVRLIAPLFDKDQVVEQSLVHIGRTRLVQRLNGELKALEPENSLGHAPQHSSTFRLKKRRGVYLAEDDYGLLVTDMTPVRGRSVLEFKPKWLLQSPSAPKDSKRCRQCAYIARDNAASGQKGEALDKSPCPLDLVSDDYNDVLHVAEIILRGAANDPPPSPSEIDPFARWIFTTKLLRRLRDNQALLDTAGPLNADAAHEKFRLAMTLRDVTVYIRYPESSRADPTTYEARIGDLDLKSADKAEAWRAKEQELISEGWYQGTEKDKQPFTCYLSRRGL